MHLDARSFSYGVMLGLAPWVAILLGVLLGWLVSAAHAHPPGSPFAAWFMAQKIPDGTGVSCCQESDAHVLEEEDIRINAGEYEVHIGENWVVFPNTGEGHKGNRVLGPVGNPIGKPVAWYSSYGTPYCLAAGSGT